MPLKPHIAVDRSQQLDSQQQPSMLSCTLSLDHVGQVCLNFSSDGLSWSLLEPSDNDDSTCLCIKFASKVTATEIKFSDVYAVELISYGVIHGPRVPTARKCLKGHFESDSESYRFTVHGFQSSTTLPSVHVLATYTFGHKDLHICQMWVHQINASLELQQGRPKNLLVFVHPRSGKGNGCKTWDSVAPIFSRAKVKTKVIVTERAGHAYDTMATIGNKELISYDGVIAVGGDGFFNEILNGFLLSRHKAPYPPTPSDFLESASCNDSLTVNDPDPDTVTEASSHNTEQSPLLPSSSDNGSGASSVTDQEPEFSFPSEHLRFGLIPAGSTDAIVMCTTGARDPMTSAFHIVFGKRVRLDVAQVVRWKTESTSKVEPYIRYATSFAGYGFYGDVITESEKYRWMGPKRYDYAGTRVFLKHKSYQAEIAYIDVKSEESNSTSEKGNVGGRKRPFWSSNKFEKVICRANCNVCRSKPIHGSPDDSCTTPHYLQAGETKWCRSKGNFLSVGAAVISNRNEKAPDGLVADAHLSDGFLHLILIKDCSHALYLWHLTQLAKKGGNPFDFKFVEHYKTPAFTFTSSGKESVWNLDGEAFQAHKLSAQVFRGLISLFATGPEV